MRASLFALATASVAAATTATLRLTEAEEALITVAAQECTDYDFPIVDALVRLDHFHPQRRPEGNRRSRGRPG